MGFVVNYPPPTQVTVDEVTGAVAVVAAGPRGPKGDTGVVTATSPATYDAPTQTVGVDQTAIAIQPSQVAGTAVVDNDVRLLPAGGATGQVLAKTSGTNYDAGWHQPGLPMPPPVVGEYLMVGFGTVANTTLSLNRVVASVIFVPRSVTVDQISVHVAVEGSSPAQGRLGIYASDANGNPSTLIVDAGLYDATTTGTKSISISPAVTLPQGPVFLVNARQTANGFQIRRRAQGAVYPRATTAESSVDSNPGVWAYRQNNVSGALPSTFTVTEIDPIPLLLSVRIASII